MRWRVFGVVSVLVVALAVVGGSQSIVVVAASAERDIDLPVVAQGSDTVAIGTSFVAAQAPGDRVVLLWLIHEHAVPLPVGLAVSAVRYRPSQVWVYEGTGETALNGHCTIVPGGTGGPAAEGEAVGVCRPVPLIAGEDALLEFDQCVQSVQIGDRWVVLSTELASGDIDQSLVSLPASGGTGYGRYRVVSADGEGTGSVAWRTVSAPAVEFVACPPGDVGPPLYPEWWGTKFLVASWLLVVFVGEGVVLALLRWNRWLKALGVALVANVVTTLVGFWLLFALDPGGAFPLWLVWCGSGVASTLLEGGVLWVANRAAGHRNWLYSAAANGMSYSVLTVVWYITNTLKPWD